MCIRIDSLVEQNVSQVLAGRPYLRDTRETQLPSSCPHSSHPTCASHMSHFAGCLVARYLPKLFSLQLLESSHSLSITQPLQSNPTINTGYKRLNRITIKFGTELKPTKHIVVNHNFTTFMYYCFGPRLLWYLYDNIYFVSLIMCNIVPTFQTESNLNLPC